MDVSLLLKDSYPFPYLKSKWTENPNVLYEFIESNKEDCVMLQKLLIWLRMFLFDNSAKGEKDFSVKSFLMENAKQTVCGHIFGPNELVVRCQVCSADSTCVLCLPCFENGKKSYCLKNGHPYSTHISNGGGMCDCGDASAYDPKAFCDRHNGSGEDSDSDPLEGLDLSSHWYVEVLLKAFVSACVARMIGTPLHRLKGQQSSLEEADSSEESPSEVDEENQEENVIKAKKTTEKQLIPFLECMSECTTWSEAAKRLITHSWTFSVDSNPEHSPLERCVVFTTCLKVNDPLLLAVCRSFQHVLSDSTFRLRFASALCRYGTLLVRFPYFTDQAVQVFTNPEVVRYLSASPPEGIDTLTHRLILDIYATLCNCRRTGEDENEEQSDTTASFFPFRISVNYKKGVSGPFSDLNHTINLSCVDVPFSILVSRTALRGFLTVLQILTVSSDVVGVSLSVERYTPLPALLTFYVAETMYAVLRTLVKLIRRCGTTCTTKAALDAFDLPSSLLPPLESTRAFEKPLVVEMGDDYVHFSKVTQLKEEETALLLPTAVEGAEGGADVFAFLRELFEETVRAMRPLQEYQHTVLCHNNKSIVLRRKVGSENPSHGGDIFEYNTFPPTKHSVLCFQHVARFSGFLFKAVIMALGGGRTGGRLYDVSATSLTNVVADTESSPLRRALTLFFASAPTSLIDDLLDALIMPTVVFTQVLQGLWRTLEDQALMNSMCIQYETSKTKYGKENDYFILQLLTMVIPPQDFAIRALQRFTYFKPEDNDQSKRKKKVGDKAPKLEETLSEGVPAFIRFLLTLITCSMVCPSEDLSLEWAKRDVANFISIHGKSTVSRMKTVLESFDTEDNSSSRSSKMAEDRLKAALKEITVSSKGSSGKEHRLKNVACWRQYVNIYSLLHDDNSLSQVATSYGSIAVGEAVDKGENGTNVKRSLPPTDLHETDFYREMVPYTRALLHTDGLLLPSLYIIAEQCGTIQKGFIPSSLLHALTAVYLCVKDVAALSAELSGEGEIQWSVVEDYLTEQGVLELSYTSDTVQNYLLLPELTGGLIRHKLTTAVPLAKHFPAWNQHPSGATTLSEVLHELRNHFKVESGEDQYSFLTMTEYILVTCGLATFAVEQTEEELSEAEAAKNQAKLRKEKQQAIMARMLRRVQKSVEDSAPEAALVESEAQVIGSLSGHLLMEFSSQECCVCRVVTKELPHLLCNVSTSNVLNQLVQGVVPDKRITHAHVYTCGHTAHMSCISKLIYANVRRHDTRRTHAVTEVPCPICKMTCNTLSPLPQLSGEGGGVTGKTMLEDIRDCALQGKEGGDVALNLHTTVANASVGVSLLTDAAPLVTTEQEDSLQKDNVDAWIISETLRTAVFHTLLMVEQVKMGTVVPNRDILALFSILVSLNPSKFKEEVPHLVGNYTRTGESLPLLLLNCLMSPSTTTAALADHLAYWVGKEEWRKEILDFLNSTEEGPIPDVVFQLWQVAAVLSVWKLLLCDEVAERLVAIKSGGEEIHVVPLDPNALQSATTMRTSVSLMLEYLLPKAEPNGDITALLVSVKAPELPVEPLSPPSHYPGTSAWVDHLLSDMLHLPKSYLSLLSALNEEGRKETVTDPVMCCGCGRILCFGKGLLRDHIRSCVGATALFCDVKHSSLFVINALNEQMITLHGIYVDENEEGDYGLRRGKPLHRSEEEEVLLAKSWVRNTWNAESRFTRRVIFVLMDRI